jgi:polysaccharide pyruvyl transferase WcaK-like protein
MRIHHFYPINSNIGDHFVQRGIERMIRTIIPDATFELFNVNSKGEMENGFGLTPATIERANREADLIIIGGSNLYEGDWRWGWGVHLEDGALENLRVPLFLMGIGTGSKFLSRPHKPSIKAEREIKLLNSHAAFSGARDVLTYNWLHRLGISKADLMGDPATFIFNHPAQHGDRDGHILITLPPLRFWNSKHRLWSVYLHGRAMFRAFIKLTRTLLEGGNELVIACNDPGDLPLAQTLFEGWFPGRVICPLVPEEYFQVISQARAVLSGRLHTAVVSFSLGIPFILMDVDQRTHGFIETYQLESWSVVPSRDDMEERLEAKTDRILRDEAWDSWEGVVRERDLMYVKAMNLIRAALRPNT